MIYLAITNLVVTLCIAIRLAWGNLQIRWLRDMPTRSIYNAPKVSIIVAARNEQREIRKAVLSLLTQDYPALQVIVVNDRSTDQTGQILDALVIENPKLCVVHNDQLPDDWLGKNHAMQIGSDLADGEYLLFTDADVVMDPTTISRAVAYCEQHALDHLALGPETPMPNALMDSFVLVFSQLFTSYVRPWKARDPHSKAHVGIGAFNLIRTQAYRSFDGHRRIAMRPDDDLKLGKLVKLNGFRQELLFGLRLVRVPWYGSLREVVVGLEKNAFSGVEYQLWAVGLATLALLAFDVWPFVAVFIATGTARWIYLGVVAMLLLMQGVGCLYMRARWWSVFYFPFTMLFIIFVVWRSSLLTLTQGGIRWRDTFYPLAKLRANRV